MSRPMHRIEPARLKRGVTPSDLPGESSGTQESEAGSGVIRGRALIFWDPEDAQTHAKMVIVDDTAVVGSTNWTVFAVEGINNELSVMLESEEIANAYREFVADLQTRGEEFDGTF